MVRALPSLALGLLVLGGFACVHKDLNPGRCNSTSDCPAGQTCDLSPQANGTCVCGSSSCEGGAGATGSGRGGVGGTITHDGGGAAGAAGQGCQSNAQCAPPTPVCVAAACVQCATSADCADPTRPICNTATNSCQACTSDQECVAKMGASDPGVCMSHVDGHCAIGAETIYVVNDSSTCVPAATVLAPGDPGKGTLTTPLCTMEQVPALLSSGTTIRDLVVVRGTVSGGDWTFNGQGGVSLSIVGQIAGDIAAGASPAFSMSGGSVFLRDLEVSSSGSTGISAAGGTIRLEHVTVDGCKYGGISLNGAAFDIENTTVANNGPSSDLSWGGIRVSAVPVSGMAKLNLVTIQNNKAAGLSCAGAIQGTGVFTAGNASGDVTPSCNVSPCLSMSTTCGAQ
jgi:hypothetical protein